MVEVIITVIESERLPKMFKRGFEKLKKIKSHSDKYVFSVVMAIFNTDEYLEEAVDSVINQTLGFKKNIQLILVNDGSTDQTERICLEYKNRYPDNVVYVYKENGGVSSARNIGIEKAEGRYINFFDSDDIWKKDSFENALKFLKKHDEETDVLTCRTFLFGLKNVEHKLNYKYKSNGVWNLDKAPAYSQCAIGNAFINRAAIGNLRFDEGLKNAEDALFLNSILLKKCTIGLMLDGGYMYRKREGSSEYSKSKYNRIVVQPKGFALKLYDLSREMYGYVKPFIAYTVMYEMQYRLTEPPSQDITEDQLEEYRNDLKLLLEEIPDRYIWRQRDMPLYKKALAFRIKHGDDFYRYVEWVDGEAFFKGTKVYSLDKETRFRAQRIETNGDCMTIDFFTDTACMNIPFEIYAETASGNIVRPRIISDRDAEIIAFDNKVLIPGTVYEFELRINDRDDYTFYVKLENAVPIKLTPRFEIEN